MKTEGQRQNLRILLASLPIWIAAVTPWGSFKLEEDQALGSISVGGIEMTMAVREFEIGPWDGFIAPFGDAEMPNWFVFVAAGGIALVSLIGLSGILALQSAAMVLAVYGAFHTGVVVYSLMSYEGEADVGIGPIIGLLGFVLVFISALRTTTKEDLT